MKDISCKHRASVFWLIFVLFMIAFTPAYAGVWDMDIAIPDNDPQWSTFKALWDNHWNGKNTEQIIASLNGFVTTYPSSIEAKLWLSKIYSIKARRSKKAEDYRQSEAYAIKAREIDASNIISLKILIDIVPNLYKNTSEILKRHGQWIKSSTPLPVDEALPLMTQMPDWDKFYQLWMQRYDTDKAVQAVKMLESYAQKRPSDGMALGWACRGNYYLGEYWSSMNQHESKALPYYKKGIEYGEKAKKILPYSVPITYWYQLNLARSLQYASFVTKARYLMTFVDLLLFCSYENGLYYYFGPTLTLGTMITNAGWVAEKGMGIAGVSLENTMTSLDLAEILYPDYLYIPYAKADVLAYKGKKDEAIKILEKIMAMDTESNKYAIAENRCHQRFSKILYDKLKKQK